jgi:hypothetical protein
VVRKLLDTCPVATLFVGDISLRSRVGPPSALLRYAVKRGFTVMFGTDPLAIKQDEKLVGSFGVELTLKRSQQEVLISWSALKDALLSTGLLSGWGARNSPFQAVRRFVSSLR